jgi:hypothetical protein
MEADESLGPVHILFFSANTVVARTNRLTQRGYQWRTHSGLDNWFFIQYYIKRPPRNRPRSTRVDIYDKLPRLLGIFAGIYGKVPHLPLYIRRIFRYNHKSFSAAEDSRALFNQPCSAGHRRQSAVFNCGASPPNTMLNFHE